MFHSASNIKIGCSQTEKWSEKILQFFASPCIANSLPASEIFVFL